MQFVPAGEKTVNKKHTKQCQSRSPPKFKNRNKLINRTHFSNFAIIWKKKSFLKKFKHMGCIMIQIVIY